MTKSTKKKHAAVFLDRDDTLIHNSGDLGNPDDVELIQGAASAIASLRGLGYKIVVVTNQGGVARGKYGEADVDAVHERLSELLAEQTGGAKVDRYYYCPFHPQGLVDEYTQEHPDRKPAPGMLLRGAEDLDLDLSNCWMVGDQIRDVQAGAAAGTRTILIREDADRLAPLTISQMENAKIETSGNDAVVPDYMAKNVVEAVRIIAQQRKPETSEEINRVNSNKRWDAEAMAALQKKKPAQAEDKDKKKEIDERVTGNRPFKPWSSQEANRDIDERGWIKKPAAVLREEAKHKPVSAADSEQPAPVEQPQQRIGDKLREMANKPPAEPVASEPKPQPKPVAEITPTPEPAVVKQEQPEPKAEPIPSRVNPKVSPAVEPVDVTPSPSKPQPAPASKEQAAKRSHVSTESERTLKLILKEIRQLKGIDEMSVFKVFVVILQMAAILCYVGGLWLGKADFQIFVKSITAGIMIQLGTIAMLMTMGHRRG
ncbi:HAD-IIIA family hydrolase [Planctomycetota bacterium]|nr:HAD-IIIA family hydrolase [Planctomycetota bacterium]